MNWRHSHFYLVESENDGVYFCKNRMDCNKLRNPSHNNKSIGLNL